MGDDLKVEVKIKDLINIKVLNGYVLTSSTPYNENTENYLREIIKMHQHRAAELDNLMNGLIPRQKKSISSISATRRNMEDLNKRRVL